MPTQNCQKCIPVIFLNAFRTHIHILTQSGGGDWGGVLLSLLLLYPDLYTSVCTWENGIELFKVE